MKSYLFEIEGNEPVYLHNAGPELLDLEGFDYVAECDITASNVFVCDHVNQHELIHALRAFQKAGEELNLFKRAMFRKQTRQEAGLPYKKEDLDPAFTVDALVAGMGLDDFFHGIIGVGTESAELAELLADVLEGKRKPDLTNVREEVGDVLWYLSRLVKWADTTFLTEMKRNIAKLRARHGESGFNKERDMNRNLGSERKLLEE